MRLLDQITQHTTALGVRHAARTPATAATVLPGAWDYAAQIARCPLRYVLHDELTSTCAQLALAGGDRLRGCLDLIHLPATSMWMEGNDAAQNGTSALPGATRHMVRVGALICASVDGRRGMLRTFWTDEQGAACVAPLETHLNLSSGWPAEGTVQSVLAGGYARVSDPDDAGLDALMECMRFRFDPQWAAYYQRTDLPAGTQAQLLRTSLATVARDKPLVLAFSLLLGARAALRGRPVSRARLNRRRALKRKRPLLEHIEVGCQLDWAVSDTGSGDPSQGRRPARLHHVRGHLVRRGNEVYWRKPHMRGRATLGRMRSRTVRLSFGRGANAPAPPTALR